MSAALAMSRASRWAFVASTVAVLGAGLVLAFLLSITTSNPTLYERHYVWLFWVNVAFASVLVVVIVITGIRLVWRVTRGRFGSRLLREAEAEAKRRGCARAVLYTISFQAPDFYRKQGYEAFGEVPCEPDGASRVFMVKVL